MVRKEVGRNDQIRDFFFFRWNREICRWIGCEVRGKGIKGNRKVFGMCNWVNGGFSHKYGGKLGGTEFGQSREK